jgi:[glutamine synthetase] adenylyltransferase / [glutamine synthetase]-adenylyl-L-tyrosine phosphorylase
MVMADTAWESLDTHLAAWGVRDRTRGQQNLKSISSRLPAALVPSWLPLLNRLIPVCADPDMALNNLERFLSVDAALAQAAALTAETHPSPLEVLIQLFSTSQYLTDLLIAQPGEVTRLAIPLRHSPTREELIRQLQTEADAMTEDGVLLSVIRQFRQRELLRIGANDILRDRPLEEITRDISTVAEAAVEVALQLAQRTMAARYGPPVQHDGQPARCVILAFGKLGGEELNYSSDIDLMVVFDQEGETQGRKRLTMEEFYTRVTTELVRLLTAYPPAYRLDFRLRPEGERGPLARSLASTLAYYDTLGRTWERQALIKVRPIAGDLALGNAFLQSIEPFVYRKYLTFAEINEIKALKRRIERRTQLAGENNVDVKTGHGGIRDVEFIIQFLQLLNGGDLESVRRNNTLQAIQALTAAGCLTDQESAILEDTYRFLRKAEHRLQLMFDLQTHRLPDRDDELNKLALRMGYPRQGRTGGGQETRISALYDFCNDYKDKAALNRTILNHLLHETFSSDNQAEPEADLVLDPHPEADTIREVLGKYRFKDVDRAYINLMHLATEPVPFLSTLRCRHFLASCAPQLLRALAEAPDPDMALNNLEKVTDSLGARGVLWELFSFNSPSLKLFVDLCAWSEFLSQILISNPGMSDELLDSLILQQPRSLKDLQTELAELCHGAAETDLILHSFQDKELLRIGVNDILGKETLPATLAALSDLAETILVFTANQEYSRLTSRWGEPRLAEGPRAGEVSRYVLLGLGKLGGGEMNYHSDLDLVLIYEGDGMTEFRPHGPSAAVDQGPRTTDNYHFFSELGRAIIHKLSHAGPKGKLYAVDMRLRPTGKSGSLAVRLSEFRRYHAEGQGQFWERLALTRARTLGGETAFAAEVMLAVHEATYGPTWQQSWFEDFLTMRRRLEASGSATDLKRGFGGIVDVEFLVQLYQLRYGGSRPALRVTNTWEALEALQAEGVLLRQEYEEIKGNYDFLRRVESRMRIVHNLVQSELPRGDDLEKLSRRLGYEAQPRQPAAKPFLTEMDRRTARTRELFLACVERERGQTGMAASKDVN